MIIKRKKVDGASDRQFLIGMVVNTKFLSSVMTFYDPKLVENKFVRRVSDLCAKYYQRYKKAPGQHIEHLFEAESENMESSERELIRDLLISLSDQYERAEQLNVEYLLDHTEKMFKLRSLTDLGRTLSTHVSSGNVEDAESALHEFRQVGRSSASANNPFRSSDTIASAFEKQEKGLFTLPGELGRMLNQELNRDHFLAILGSEKRGKTWWLNELAIRAAKARCNVALFQIGDMTKDQTIVRLSIRLCGRSNQQQYCGSLNVPVPDCLLGQCGKCKRHARSQMMVTDNDNLDPSVILPIFQSRQFKEHEPCTECMNENHFKGSVWYEKRQVDKPLAWRDAWKVGTRFLGRIKGRDFKLSVHASDALSVSGIRAILNSWEMYDEFIPDVVVIDYADNLAPEDRREEYRHQQNRTWKLLRGLSQERHCLVITATQANAKSYDQKLLNMKNFSEDKRKYGHVTAMIGLNQTDAEKKGGLMRINMIVQREGEFNTGRAVGVAQCLQMGRPLLFSF